MSSNRDVLDLRTVALLELAIAIAIGKEALLWEKTQEAFDFGVPPEWVDELILQSTLIVGWPRSLTAAARWRKTVGEPATGGGGELDYSEWPMWQARGEAACREVYGDTYDLLRESVKKLHPTLDLWMVTEAYGRTLSRPLLDLRRRELCTVAQTAALNTPRQLHSHLRGSLNAGATAEEIEATLALVHRVLPDDEWIAVWERWEHVRDRWSAKQ